MIEHRADGTCALHVQQPPASLTELCVALEIGLSALNAPGTSALLVVVDAHALQLDPHAPWLQRWTADPKRALHESTRWQQTLRDLRRAEKPIVFVLQPARESPPSVCGLDAELALACTARVVPQASRWGLSHLPRGWLPFGGACTMLVCRAVAPHMLGEEVDAVAYLQPLLKMLVEGACLDAVEARRWGWLGANDLLLPPHKTAFALAFGARLALLLAESSTAREALPFYAAGQRAKAALMMGLHVQRWGGFLDEATWQRAQRLVHVLCGGDLALPQWVSEDYGLALEREAFAAALESASGA